MQTRTSQLSVRPLLLLILMLAPESHAVGWESPLAGKYKLESVACIPALTSDWTNANVRGFTVGATVEIKATAKALQISSALDSVVFTVGVFDRSGPVSDGPSSHTNQYFNHGTGFSSAHDKLLPTDNPGSGVVFTKVPTGLFIIFDGVQICVLAPSK